MLFVVPTSPSCSVICGISVYLGFLSNNIKLFYFEVVNTNVNNHNILFGVCERKPWLKLALSQAGRRSAMYYGSGLAPEPGTRSADLSCAAPRRAEPRQHYERVDCKVDCNRFKSLFNGKTKSLKKRSPLGDYSGYPDWHWCALAIRKAGTRLTARLMMSRTRVQ